MDNLLNDIKEDFKVFEQNCKNRLNTTEKTKEGIKEITKSINNFFREQKLDACTIGISGGIDSAVALALLTEAQKQENSPLKKVVPVTIPFNNVKGATDQEDSTYYARLVVDKFLNEEIKVINLEEAYKSIVHNSGLEDNDEYAWVNGQMLSVLRTPVLYHQAALLQKDGYKSIVVGTVNKVEYHLGYWGKASDMMVDLQILTKLLKFEVYNIAKELGVPDEVINRIPKGDVYDNKSDYEMIGAPYEFLDIMLHDSQNYDETGKINDSIDYVKYSPFTKNVYYKQIVRNNHKRETGHPCHFLYW